jgi:hypothetical protein
MVGFMTQQEHPLPAASGITAAREVERADRDTEIDDELKRIDKITAELTEAGEQHDSGAAPV